MPNEEKEKFTYSEWSDVLDELDNLRMEESRKLGREVSLAEFIRRMTLTAVNKNLKRKGEPLLDLDPESNPADRRNVA